MKGPVLVLSSRQRSSRTVARGAQPCDSPGRAWRPAGVQSAGLVRSWSAAILLLVLCASASGCTSTSSPRAVTSGPAPATGTATSGALTPTNTPAAAPSASSPNAVPQATPGSRHSVAPPTIARTTTLAVFVGQWSGHTRALTISASGVGHERVSDGCCDPLLDLTFQLSNVHGSGPKHATATVTAVMVHAGWSKPDFGAPPYTGQQGEVTITGGVITDHLDHIFYCNPAEQAKGTCGA